MARCINSRSSTCNNAHFYSRRYLEDVYRRPISFGSNNRTCYDGQSVFSVIQPPFNMPNPFSCECCDCCNDGCCGNSCGCDCGGCCDCNCGCNCGGCCDCNCGCDCCCDMPCPPDTRVQFSISDIDNLGRFVPGATFRLTSGGLLVDTLYTNTNGEAHDFLSYGKTYQLRQVSVPMGYVLDTTVYNIHVDYYGNIYVNGVLRPTLVIVNDILLR